MCPCNGRAPRSRFLHPRARIQGDRKENRGGPGGIYRNASAGKGHVRRRPKSPGGHRSQGPKA
eukprot:7918234-Heterocapsa_arctica.AAC.1